MDYGQRGRDLGDFGDALLGGCDDLEETQTRERLDSWTVRKIWDDEPEEAFHHEFKSNSVR